MIECVECGEYFEVKEYELIGNTCPECEARQLEEWEQEQKQFEREHGREL